MRFQIRHGSVIDALTPGEADAMFIKHLRPDQKPTRIRAAENIVLDAAGAGTVDVFTVPPGRAFAVRRVTVDLDTAADPSTGNVPLNVAGRSVELLRSGTRIEYAAPTSPNVTPQVPGVQTWGAEQGPYLQNGEVFSIRVRGLTPGSRFNATVEGIMGTRPEDVE